MTRARTLADMISDGVIGTTELADDVITPVKLDETGNYTVAQLSVDGVAQIRGVTVKDSSGTTKGYVQGDGDGLLIASDGSNNITFDVNAVERVRIDASGNLMVGNTNGNPIGNHVSQIIANGANGLGVHRDGGVPFKAGTDSDRNIIEVYRQGSLVGALGVADSDNLVITSTASNHGGLKFNNTAMAAYVNGASSDNTMSIGTSVVRFSDLHLGGKIYVDADNTDSGHKLQIGEYNTIGHNQAEGETKLIHIDDSYVMRVAREHNSGDIASTGWYSVAKIPAFGTSGKCTVSMGGDFTADVVEIDWISSVNTALNNSVSRPRLRASGTFANVTTPRITQARIARATSDSQYYIQVYVASGVNNNTNGKSLLEVRVGDYVENSQGSIQAMFNAFSGTTTHDWTVAVIPNGVQQHGIHTKPEQPSFYAFRQGGNYNAASSGWEKVLLDGTRWNTGGHYSTTTQRFTAPVDGVYQFNLNVNRYNVNDDLLLAVALYVNGSVYAYGNRFHSRGTTDLVASMSSTIKLSANDHVEPWSYSNDAATGFSSGANWNTFSGHLIG